MTMASQGDIVRRHVDDAAAARRPGGPRRADPRLFPNEHFLAPTVLLDVPEDNAGDPRGDLRADADDHQGARRRGGAELANATAYGLGGAVFSKSKAAAWTSPAGCAAA